MYSSAPAVLFAGGNGQFRSLTSISGAFLIASCSPTESNSMMVVEYDEASNVANVKTTVPISHQVRVLRSHPTRDNFLMVGSDKEAMFYEYDSSFSFELVGNVNVPGLQTCVWEPREEEDDDDDDDNRNIERATERFATLGKSTVKLWDMSEGRTMDIGDCDIATSRSLSWDPHHVEQLSVGGLGTISTVDIGSMKVVSTITKAHDGPVLDLDYNPNKPYALASAGADRYLRFWDLRNPKTAVTAVLAHHHWVSGVKYNRFHDQLVLSCGTDASAKLWGLGSISSAPILEEPEDEDEDSGLPISGGSSNKPDSLITPLDDFSESVYGLAWSRNDAWTYAALGYDGKLVIHQVPSAEKYKILL